MKKVICGIIAFTVFSYTALAQTDSTSTGDVKKTTTETNVKESTTNPDPAVKTSTDINVNQSAVNQSANKPTTANKSNDYIIQQYYDRMDADRIGTYKLTEQQMSQYKTINEDYDRNIGTLNEAPGTLQDDLDLKRSSFRDERRKKYMELLSPADRESYKSYIDESNNNYIRWNERRTDLNLTEEQYKKLNDLNSSYTEKEVMTINNKDLTDEDRNKQLRAMREERTGSYKSILSPDQATKLKIDGNKMKIKDKNKDETKKEETKTKTEGM